MKNFKIHLAWLTIVFMLFTSCSKEEEVAIGGDPANKGTLSFGAYLNDLVSNKAALKQAVSGLPECSDDAPAFVEIVLSRGNEPVVGTVSEPFRVTVNPTPQDYDGDGETEYFTDESASLELVPGTYTLEYFTVLNSEAEVIWVAPIDNGTDGFASFVDSSLPMDIALGAGVKKYVDVEVLCFDDREVNEYGYLFFDLDTNEAFEFCFFANYCPSSVHFPAAISVDIWIGDDSTGVQIYSDDANEVGTNDSGELFARSVCFALPDLEDFSDDEDYIYYEVTLLDWEGAYGDVEQTVISGNLSRNDVMENFDGDNNIDYEHLRFGCDDDSGDDDGDGDDGDGDDGDDDNGDGDDGDDGDDDDGDGDDDNGDGDGDDDDGDDDDGDDDNGDGDDGDDGDNDDEPLEKCETAFMKADTSFFNMNFKNNRWGWAEFWEISEDGDEETFEFWAAAGQNDTSKGTHVGNITINVDGDDVQFTIDMFDGNSLDKAHIYLDGDEPTKTAPGQFTYKSDDLSFSLEVEDYNEEGFWIIVHGDVCPQDR